MRDGAPDLQDMFGNPEVERKSKPVKGQRYLIFTMIMMIFLCFMVETKEKSQLLTKYSSASNSTSNATTSSDDSKSSSTADSTTASSNSTTSASTSSSKDNS